jgi:hypothetical protein
MKSPQKHQRNLNKPIFNPKIPFNHFKKIKIKLIKKLHGLDLFFPA